MSALLAKHLREVYFGGNWTWVNLKETLADTSWEEATEKVSSFNTIASLVYHINYYVLAISGVLQGVPLESKDKFSFDVPHLRSGADWEDLLDTVWKEAEKLISLIEQFPEDKLDRDFYDNKYGSYHRNFLGLIEHTHYHLGQIVLIKKYLRNVRT